MITYSLSYSDPRSCYHIECIKTPLGLTLPANSWAELLTRWCHARSLFAYLVAAQQFVEIKIYSAQKGHGVVIICLIFKWRVSTESFQWSADAYIRSCAWNTLSVNRQLKTWLTSCCSRKLTRIPLTSQEDAHESCHGCFYVTWMWHAVRLNGKKCAKIEKWKKKSQLALIDTLWFI